MCYCYLCFITDFKPLKKIPNKKASFIENSCCRLKIFQRFTKSSRRQANDLNNAEFIAFLYQF